MPNSIPGYLRVDQDIKKALIHLENLMNEYADFDIVQLDRDQARKLELGLDKQSAQYKQHREQVYRALEKATDELEEIIKLKTEIVESRL
jgi:ribosome-associated translation inhibitor RaiA